jgi:hypothetical protein
VVVMLWCTHSVLELEIHIGSEVVTSKISLILSSFKNHIDLEF